jgi:hypothetical protein
MAIWSILLPFRIFYGNYVVFWNIFSRFGLLCQEKSGNPDEEADDFFPSRNNSFAQWPSL